MFDFFFLCSWSFRLMVGLVDSNIVRTQPSNVSRSKEEASTQPGDGCASDRLTI